MRCYDDQLRYKVAAEDVRHVAELANLELTAHEEAGMIRDLNAILGHLDQLNELDVTDIQPMAQVSEVLSKDDALGRDADARLRTASGQGSSQCLPRSTVMSSAPGHRWRVFQGATGDGAVEQIQGRLERQLLFFTAREPSIRVQLDAPCQRARQSRPTRS